jgi:predicted MPP superfamily phosphohydrolase
LWPTHPILAPALIVPWFVSMLAWQFVYRADSKVLEKEWFRSLAWLGSLMMGIWATFILFSIPLDFLHLTATVLGHWLPWPFLEPEPRQQIFQSLRLGLLTVSGAMAVLGWLEVFRGPRTREVRVPIMGLVDELSGLKIVHISDLHVGPTIRKEYVAKVVRLVNEALPDLIAITGDLVDGTAEAIAAHLEPLAGLRSRLGVFYVTGNHEYYWGAESLIAKARTLGFQPLINENRVLEVGGAKLLIGGVTDSSAGMFIQEHKSEAAKAFHSPQLSHFKILLAHRPSACIEAEPLGFDLQLSGHTHAGQFFPFSLLAPLVHKYYRGLNRHGRMWVYVNPGTGYWGPANRFGVASEITLLRLAST